MNKNPLVSILLLSMNHEAYIEKCITSLQEQTYKNIEIIYLDNVSKDDTYIKGITLLKNSPIPYKAFRNNESQSISKNLNFLLEESSGDYISPLSADDWFEKENIEKKVTQLCSKRTIGALFSNGWLYYESNDKMVLNDSSLFKKGHIFKELLTQPECIFYVGVIYRRSIFHQVGNWDENLYIEDLDMYIRISLIAEIDFINEPLVYYRKTDGSVSQNKTYMISGFQQYYHKYKNEKWINMKYWLSERYRSFAANYIDQKNNKEATVLLKEAIKLNPFGLKNHQTLFYLIRSAIK